MKKHIITLLLICVILFINIYSINAEEQNPKYPEFYPRMTIVIAVYNNTVVCLDKECHLWAFYNDNYIWTTGDICNMLIWNLSYNIREHPIVAVYKEGHSDNFFDFISIAGWEWKLFHSEIY